MLQHENKARQDGFSLIIGIDEAGRGPLAGPVVAAAVFLTKNTFSTRITDSKKLTPQAREKAFHEINDSATIGIGVMNENIIDAMNILNATYSAMNGAVDQLVRVLLREKAARQEDLKEKICLLVDGKSFKSDLPYVCRPIVDGDSLSLSIAAASIVAKVTRDRYMRIYDRIYPEFGFRDHKGYGTQRHRQAIKKYGPCAIHRRSFQGVL